MASTTSEIFAQKRVNVTEAGKKLYNKHKCSGCHGIDGKSPVDLTTGGNKYDKATLKKYILNPKQFDNHRMPAFKDLINETELTVLVEYVAGLGKKH